MAEPSTLELAALWAALAAYAAFALLAVPALAASFARATPFDARGPARPVQRAALAALALAVALHTLSIGARWGRVGHGPFTTMHEILGSNLWSLALVLLLAACAVRELRGALLLAVPVLALLAPWLLMADAGRGHLPATYDTPLLYLHTLVGKGFLGLLLAAVAIGGVPLLRRSRRLAATLVGGPDDRRCDALAHRFAAAALVFDTLMLIVGAVWAQDAWGRYWAWDPLESWAFLTWLGLVAALHARATLRPAPARFGAWLIGVFVIAFLTFFGVPFLSTVPHQGAI